jgi:hypothetical protein
LLAEISDVNIMFESDAHAESGLDSGSGSERGSRSLVGRGIANPQEFFETYLKANNKRNIKQIMYTQCQSAATITTMREKNEEEHLLH